MSRPARRSPSSSGSSLRRDDLAGYAWFALVGAGIAATAVFAIGSTRGGPDPVSLVLAGAAVSALLLAVTQAIVLRDSDTLDAYRFWVVGSASGRELSVFWAGAPVPARSACCSPPPARRASTCSSSATTSPLRSACTRGARRRWASPPSCCSPARATAACGPIGFVGLVVPHVARRFAGVDYRWVVPYSALLGGLLLTVADVIGRVVVRPGELQVGIVMALIGGPVFVLLVRRTRMVRI